MTTGSHKIEKRFGTYLCPKHGLRQGSDGLNNSCRNCQLCACNESYGAGDWAGSEMDNWEDKHKDCNVQHDTQWLTHKPSID